MNVLRNSPNLKPNMMRPFLKDCCPPNMTWNAAQLSNLRKKLLQISSKMTPDQVMRREHFQKQFRNDGFWKGFLNNDGACFYADKSTFECREMYDELWGGCIFQSTEDSDNSKSTLIKINQVYKATDDGFDFSVLVDGESRIIACGVWQSAAMLDAFDRYGSYCCLDVMM